MVDQVVFWALPKHQKVLLRQNFLRRTKKIEKTFWNILTKKRVLSARASPSKLFNFGGNGALQKLPSAKIGYFKIVQRVNLWVGRRSNSWGLNSYFLLSKFDCGTAPKNLIKFLCCQRIAFRQRKFFLMKLRAYLKQNFKVLSINNKRIDFAPCNKSIMTNKLLLTDLDNKTFNFQPRTTILFEWCEKNSVKNC